MNIYCFGFGGFLSNAAKSDIYIYANRGDYTSFIVPVFLYITNLSISGSNIRICSAAHLFTLVLNFVCTYPYCICVINSPIFDILKSGTALAEHAAPDVPLLR